jgi:hypothetical protein
MKAFQMREDYGAAPLSDCYLQYYYYIPCPTYSWFWAFSFQCPDEVIGVLFDLGDVSMGTGLACDPEACHSLETLRIFDYAGYGTAYPGRWTIRFDVYCSDELACPIGPPIWTSGPEEFVFGWNYIDISPPVCLTPCCTAEDPVPSSPRILITATGIGTDCSYPVWGFDNIGTCVEEGCVMHDIGCLPALCPRPTVSHYDMIHTGYYGFSNGGFEYCPPLWFCDGKDLSSDCSETGFIEALWRIYLGCTGPTADEPTTWGNIKSIYR